MAGDRYGWVPLPYIIEKDEMEALLGEMSADEEAKVLEWYQEDLNQTPVSYIIKERTGSFGTHDVWEKEEAILRNILQNKVSASSLTEIQKCKYFLSATEAEVEEGIIDYLKPTAFQENLITKNLQYKQIDSEYVFGFLRHIAIEEKNSSTFIDEHYDKAQKFKKRIKSVLPDHNVLEVDTKLIGEIDLDTNHLGCFEEKVTAFLERSVNVFMKETKVTTPLQKELEAQAFHAKDKRYLFQGRKDSLKAIADYITGPESREALVVYGASGLGKSTLMAKAIESSKADRTLYRFVGATPNASVTTEILTSIFEELGIDVRHECQKERGRDNEEEVFISSPKLETFEHFSYRIHDEIIKLEECNEKIAIFIDAVDQLHNDDQFLWLPRILPENIKIIISALDDVNYKEDSKYFQTLKSKTVNLHKVPPFEEPLAFIHTVLETYKRTIQPHQEAYILKQYASSQSPLYLCIAAEEIRHWKSFVAVENEEESKYEKMYDLAHTQQGIIREFIDNLHDVYHHDAQLCEKVLGYLYASKEGLSEIELLTLLSTDSSFVEAMAPDTWHENSTKDLPVVIWTRLHTQLKPFLRINTWEGHELMCFFHREFEDVIKNLPCQQQEHEACIRAVQQLVSEYQNEPFESNRWGELYILLIVHYCIQGYDELFHKKACEFVGCLNNEEWIDKTLDRLNKEELYYRNQNKISVAIAYIKSCNLVSSFLYTENPDRWAKKYAYTLNGLAYLYYYEGDISKVMQLKEKALKIRKYQYNKDNQEWAKEYVSSLISLASTHKDIGNISEAVKFENSAAEISEKEYLGNPNEWADNYVRSLIKQAITYRDNRQINKAIELCKKALTISEKHYDSDTHGNVEIYVRSLNNLSRSYLSKKDYESSIFYSSKSLNILETLYKQNPDRWAKEFIINANSLAKAYKDNKQLDKCIELEDEIIEITTKLYNENSSVWVKYYILAISNRANSFVIEGNNEKSLELYNICLPIVAEQYEKNLAKYKNLYNACLKNLIVLYSRKGDMEEVKCLEETLNGLQQ